MGNSSQRGSNTPVAVATQTPLPVAAPIRSTNSVLGDQMKRGRRVLPILIDKDEGTYLCLEGQSCTLPLCREDGALTVRPARR